MPIQRYVRKANIQQVWPGRPAAVPSIKLSVCCHCPFVATVIQLMHGAFDPRDALVHAISPNVLAETSKEVEKSKITS